MTRKSFTVHVPATTANLGPGFDCLGMALDLWNSTTFSIEGNDLLIEIKGEGKGQIHEDKRNLIYQSALTLAKRKNKTLPENLRIVCDNEIPISSGLGSSASAVICGLVGAREILKIDISDEDLIQIAAEIEGHADNVSAGFLGGLVLVRIGNSKYSFRNLEMQPITAVIAQPNYSVSTNEARKALPKEIPLVDAIFNISHAIDLTAIFQNGNYGSLQDAMNDRLHQPYRLSILPGAEKAMESAKSAGAYGACLSGAGPSVIAFSLESSAKAIGLAMKESYIKVGKQARIFILNSPGKRYYLS